MVCFRSGECSPPYEHEAEEADDDNSDIPEHNFNSFVTDSTTESSIPHSSSAADVDSYCGDISHHYSDYPDDNNNAHNSSNKVANAAIESTNSLLILYPVDSDNCNRAKADDSGQASNGRISEDVSNDNDDDIDEDNLAKENRSNAADQDGGDDNSAVSSDEDDDACDTDDSEQSPSENIHRRISSSTSDRGRARKRKTSLTIAAIDDERKKKCCVTCAHSMCDCDSIGTVPTSAPLIACPGSALVGLISALNNGLMVDHHSHRSHSAPIHTDHVACQRYLQCTS